MIQISVVEAVEPIEKPKGYPMGFMYKNYTQCHGKWYPKSYKCVRRIKRNNNNVNRFVYLQSQRNSKK